MLLSCFKSSLLPPVCVRVATIKSPFSPLAGDTPLTARACMCACVCVERAGDVAAAAQEEPPRRGGRQRGHVQGGGVGAELGAPRGDPAPAGGE